MKMPKIHRDTPRQKTLRLWPGVAIVVLQWLAKLVLPVIMPEAPEYGVYGSLLGGVAILIWWVFFSRAPLFDRLGAAALLVGALAGTPHILHESIATAGGGWLFLAYAIPVLSLAFVAAAVAGRHLADLPRRITMAATIMLACGLWALIRTGGITNDLDSDFAWRWAKTPEERMLDQAGEAPMALPSTQPLPEIEPEWPGFRGPHRDGIVRGVQIETDWTASPPVELWRRPVGPGWSSFAVHGNLLFTQEQRGENEAVSCYHLTTGKLVWRHSDAARFWESNAGAGPRGTPTLSGGRVYSLGATGILNVLNARDGSVVWSRNVGSDTDTKVPMWGFSSSPLVVDDVVIIAAANSLIAYDLTTGEPRWTNAASGQGYSSPHLLRTAGAVHVLLQNGSGVSGFSPVDGTRLWEFAWKGQPIVQPAITKDGDILISVDDRNGIRRIAVAHEPGGWSARERWSSVQLQPYFNDSVIHNGHAYGFHGPKLACIDIENGMRKWKGGRYGRGQMILLADQGLLLVLSEKGEVALVEAAPDRFSELSRFPALEGKTWNHPVLVGDILLVRNSREMAAFRLPLARSGR